MKRTIFIFAGVAVCFFFLGFWAHVRFEDEVKEYEARLATFGYVRVEKVSDGDTLRINPWWGRSRRVRLLGIDTPETVKPGSAVECFGPEASAYLKTLISGHRVRIVFDPSQGIFDDEDRLLAYVYRLDGTFVNLDLIQKGFAEEWTYRKAHSHQEEFRKAEDAARIKRTGRWGECGLDSKKRKRR